ncbi:MAG: hypothetical protein R8L58_01500 [Mariprofundaceae bacterium]
MHFRWRARTAFRVRSIGSRPVMADAEAEIVAAQAMHVVNKG